jgi:ferredoxin
MISRTTSIITTSSLYAAPRRWRRLIIASVMQPSAQSISAANNNNKHFARFLSSFIPTAIRNDASYNANASNYNIRRFSILKDDSTAQSSPMQQTNVFLLSLGYSDAVSKGIIDALIQNGIPHSSLLSMVKGLAGRYEVDEDAGLQILASSVKKELENEQGKERLKVWFLPSTGWSSEEDDDGFSVPTIHSTDRAFPVEVTEGTNLADVARFGTSENCDVLREYLECACSGIMACSTCHVVIHPEWFDSTITSDEVSANDVDQAKIGTPSEPEQDMIDLAFEPQSTSRLGCQITLTKDLDGLVILLPEGSNNLMDDIPFDD